MIRSTLTHTNPDVFERIVLDLKVPLPGSLDPKLKRAIVGITGAVYPDSGDAGDDASDADDDMPALEQASVVSADENEWEEHGESKLDDALPPGKLEPRAFNRPGQSRPAPGLRRDPITEQVKQHAEQIARKEAKVRAARRRQADADEVRARAERPEELFQHEREERDRLRVEKGFVVDDEDEENPKIYTCCLKELQTGLKGVAKVNVATLTCKYDEEEYGIRANAHRLRMDCEKGCELRCHHPSCVRALTVCGLHSKEQPWGKMDAKNTSQQLSKDGLVMKCLRAGCDGRLIRTAIEKDRGVRRAEVWYHAKWHQDIIEEEERQKKLQEEEAARVRAEAEEERRKEEKAAEVEAKKAAKQAAKVAKEAARRPDLVGLDGVQVPVPPKKPQKAKAQAEAEKVDVPKPDLSEVERMIEQEGAASAAPRKKDDIYDTVPEPKKERKERKKRDRRQKKVLDGAFAEQQDDAENVGGPGVDAAVERAVQNVTQPAAAEASAAPAPLAEEFPDLAAGSAQASGAAGALAMLEARNFREEDDSLPVTPFLLCKNLDVATLLQPGAPPVLRRFKNCLPRIEVRQVRVFEEQTCAALEVSYYDGASACKALNGQLLGTKPVIASHLIEFPDVELMAAISEAQDSTAADKVIRYVVAQRREARAERKLPTFEELQAVRSARAAAEAAAPPPAPVQEPPGKGASSATPPSMNPVAPSFQPGGKAAPSQPAAPTASAPAPAARPAPPAAPDAPPPGRTFADAEKWLRSNEAHGDTPSQWLSVTDLYVLGLRSATFEAHYKPKSTFVLDYKHFPGYKEVVDEGRQVTAALVIYEKETSKIYGVMRMEPQSEREKVSCKPFIEDQPGLQEAASKPAMTAEMDAEIKGISGVAKRYHSAQAWQILDAFSKSYGLTSRKTHS